jgi:X-Pro dipeptidyl-peptidase
VGGENESLAPKAVVDWLCGRAKGYTTPDGGEEVTADWSTGKVGMTGTSYNGTLPLAAATTGVEGLEAIIPIAPNTSYYHYYRSNGLIRHPGGYMGEDIDVLYNFINSGDPEKREYCNCEIRDKEMANGFDRVTGDYNEFWAGRDYLNKIDNVKAAVLMAHAFNDWNVMPEHSVRIYSALKNKGVPVQCYFHQGGHGGEPPLKQMNRWFTRYVYGIENGVEDDPKAWIVREGDRRSEPTSYADYPNPDAAPVTLYPSEDGNDIGQLGLIAPDTKEPQTLIDNVEFRGSALASAASSENRLLFATAELKEPIHISGTVKIRTKVAANKPAANLSVWLVSLPWTDKARTNDNLITRGWADPQNAKSLTESQPLIPGEFVELNFDLQPDDQIIPAGQKIGLMIFSSDRDFTLWPEPGTELSVDVSATAISIPVVGGQAKFELATGQ